jgi:hypothetical protein
MKAAVCLYDIHPVAKHKWKKAFHLIQITEFPAEGTEAKAQY